MPERRWWPRKVTAAQILEQAEADARRAREQPVAFHQEQARYWRYSTRTFLVLALTLVALIIVVDNRWLSATYALLTFWMGTRWHSAQQHFVDNARSAWTAENEQTLQALADGGLLAGRREAIEVMREAEPPPGISRREWVRHHTELLAEYDRRHGT